MSNPLIETRMELSKKEQLFRDKWSDRVNSYFSEKKRIPRESPKDKTETKRMIEKAAVAFVKMVYEKWGYMVISRENDKCVWHLDALKKKKRLKLLVRGLGLREFLFSTTQQEYDAVLKNPKSFRFCLVVNAIKNPILTVFVFDEETGKWTLEDGLLGISSESLSKEKTLEGIRTLEV